ncbi:dihydropyrimidine dehydrogenase subunit B [Clostridia bacterium]|nr:dihydropyrimidine dehydrogenase subunit B [Clostridia bacterium]
MKTSVIDPIKEASRCLMCGDAPCAAACPNGRNPAKFVAGVRFGLGKTAARYADCPSGKCGKLCEKACIQPDFPIRISKIREAVSPLEEARADEIADAPSLAVDFLGVRCPNPFLISSSIASATYEMCAAALRAGWGGVVFKTIGAGPIRDVSPRFDSIGKEGTPFLGFRNLEQISDKPLTENLAAIRRLKKEFPDRLIAASIMGSDDAEWAMLTKECERAGADLVELNFSCPHMEADGKGSDVGQSAELVARYTSACRKASRIPLLAKMTPNLGDMTLPAAAALEAGADGIAAINTVKSFTGFASGGFDPVPLLNVSGKSAISGYSGKAVKPIALRFLIDLKKCEKTAAAPLSGMGGIETFFDALDFFLVGCQTVQVTTAVMQYGYRIIEFLTDGLREYMRRGGVKSAADFIGKGLNRIEQSAALDRESVSRVAIDYGKCVKCGRCVISCRDGGHQAIVWDRAGRKAAIDGGKCVGCHLCKLVCPVGAIG